LLREIGFLVRPGIVNTVRAEGAEERKTRGRGLMEINHVTDQVLGTAVAIHREFGPGLLESVYEALMEKGLQERGLRVRRQQPIRLNRQGITFEEAFRADLIVEDRVIVEIKSVPRLAPVSALQLRTYLRLTGLQVGLLINFGGVTLAGHTRRVVNNYQGPRPSSNPSRSPSAPPRLPREQS
jgi:GxxExxY protein